MKYVFLILFIVTPRLGLAVVLTDDTLWRGEIVIDSDVLVPEGVTLRISSGTVVQVHSAKSTKTDPEYLSPLTEITVRGTIVVEGSPSLPVFFLGADDQGAHEWAGIIVDNGKADLNSCRIMNAETGVSVVSGMLRMRDSLISRNRYGLSIIGVDSNVGIVGGVVAANDYGVVLVDEASVTAPSTAIRGNHKKNIFKVALHHARRAEVTKTPKIEAQSITRILEDSAAVGDTVWSGRMVIDGVLRVPEGSRLIILPGTIVEFKKRDTNGDGIGESGLFLQGTLVAKGSKEKPIFFRSAEEHRKPGDWDAVNIMNSDGAQNLVEYCVFEDAYRGLHFHFSNVLVQAARFSGNYRAMQFQESNAEIRRSLFSGNRSGIQARDSRVIFSDNVVAKNLTGVSFFRIALNASGNTFTANVREGLRIREGSPVLTSNVFHGNRYGVMVADTVRGHILGNLISANGETGISFKNSDNVRVTGNFVSGNGISGMNIRDARLAIDENLISHNGEKGIGILAFQGEITRNNIVGNKLCGIDLEGDTDVSAPGNWWGIADAEKSICDRRDDPARGWVRFGNAADGPIPFAWPQQSIQGDTDWEGNVVVRQTVLVPKGTALTIRPGTKLSFAKNAGLNVYGRINALGQEDNEILFTSLDQTESGGWGEIRIERATGSAFSHCRFEYATWAIHSHFTDLNVKRCSFSSSEGGIRFRSGPMKITESLFENNRVGIRAYRGNALITHNTITGNETGLFVREKGGGLIISENNIHGNARFDIRLGDFNNENVDARHNWWGTGDPRSGFLDDRTEPGIGRVLYEPARTRPVKEPKR